jgi:hypothetical protein
MVPTYVPIDDVKLSSILAGLPEVRAKLGGGSIMIDQTVLGSKGKSKEALIGVPSATHWADTWDDPHWQAFVKAYQDAWPAEKRFPSPSFCAVNYYDETTAALLALDKGGKPWSSRGEMTSEGTCASILSGLRGLGMTS